MRTPFLVLVAVLTAASACSHKQDLEASPGAATTPSGAEPAPPPVVAPSVAATPPSAAKEAVWTDPVGWQRIAPSSSMRKATYKIPAAAKDPEDAEMAVFYFGRSEGGATEANIRRWISQFPDAKPTDVKRTERTANGMKQSVVEVEGTYSGSGMPGASSAPKTNFKLIGAVVETPAGSYFFKMTGPKKTVEGARGAYLTLLDSVRSG